MAAVFIDAEDREALWDFQVPKDVDAVQWLTDVLQPDDTLHMVKTLLTKRNIPRSCYEQLVAYVVQRQQEVSKAKAKVRVTRVPRDGDADGKIYDDTPKERPAPQRADQPTDRNNAQPPKYGPPGLQERNQKLSDDMKEKARQAAQSAQQAATPQTPGKPAEQPQDAARALIPKVVDPDQAKALFDAQKQAAATRKWQDVADSPAAKALGGGAKITDLTPEQTSGLVDWIKANPGVFTVVEKTADERSMNQTMNVTDTRTGERLFFKMAQNVGATAGDGMNEVFIADLVNQAYPGFAPATAFASPSNESVETWLRQEHVWDMAKERGLDDVGSGIDLYERLVAGRPIKLADPEEPIRIAIMDYLTANSDRHAKNVMTMAAPGEGLHLVPVDQGASFFSLARGRVKTLEDLGLGSDQDIGIFTAPNDVTYGQWTDVFGGRSAIVDFLDSDGALAGFETKDVDELYDVAAQYDLRSAFMLGLIAQGAKSAKWKRADIRAAVEKVIATYRGVNVQDTVSRLAGDATLTDYERNYLFAGASIWSSRIEKFDVDEFMDALERVPFDYWDIKLVKASPKRAKTKEATGMKRYTVEHAMVPDEDWDASIGTVDVDDQGRIVGASVEILKTFIHQKVDDVIASTKMWAFNPEDENKDAPEPKPAAAGEIVKIDPDQRLVFGWAYVCFDRQGTLVVDKSGEFVDDPEEIAKAAYDYVVHHRAGDVHHTNAKTSELVESVVFTPEKIEKMGLPVGSIPLGWWVGFRVDDDEAWGDVRSGKLRSFSVHGTGSRSVISE